MGYISLKNTKEARQWVKDNNLRKKTPTEENIVIIVPSRLRWLALVQEATELGLEPTGYFDEASK